MESFVENSQNLICIISIQIFPTNIEDLTCTSDINLNINRKGEIYESKTKYEGGGESDENDENEVSKPGIIASILQCSDSLRSLFGMRNTIQLNNLNRKVEEKQIEDLVLNDDEKAQWTLADYVCKEDRSVAHKHFHELVSSEDAGILGVKPLWRFITLEGLVPLTMNFMKYSHDDNGKERKFILECTSLLPQIRLAKEKMLRQASESNFGDITKAYEKLKIEVGKLGEAVSNLSVLSKCLVNNRNILLWKVDTSRQDDPTVTYISKAGCINILSYEPEHLVSRSLWDTVYPDDIEKSKELLKTSCTRRIRRYTKFGRLVWLEVDSHVAENGHTGRKSKAHNSLVVLVELNVTEALFQNSQQSTV